MCCYEYSIRAIIYRLLYLLGHGSTQPGVPRGVVMDSISLNPKTIRADHVNPTYHCWLHRFSINSSHRCTNLGRCVKRAFAGSCGRTWPKISGNVDRLSDQQPRVPRKRFKLASYDLADSSPLASASPASTRPAHLVSLPSAFSFASPLEFVSIAT